jgi:hypothetical protein
VLSARHVPADMSIEQPTDMSFVFAPPNASEYVRVADAIKKGLPDGLDFRIACVDEATTMGVSNRGDDEDILSFRIHVGQRVTLVPEIHEN